MKFIKLGIISVLVLFIVVLLISLLIPSRVRISRAINIDANRDSIMNNISLPENWVKWFPGMDTAKPMLVKGKTVGYVVNEKKGGSPVYLKLINAGQDEVMAEFVSSKLNPATNAWKLISHSQSDSLTVQWYMEFKLRWYPWEKFSSLLFEGMYGPGMEEGLSRLKRIAEK